MKEKVIVSWSGGKDSALALYELSRIGGYEVAALLTTVTEEYDRVSMHGLRRFFLEQQAKSLGFALEKVFISKKTCDEEYESKMRRVLEKYLSVGVRSVVFGDVFLGDVRKRREKNLSQMGIKAVFPIWQRDTAELARAFIDLGFKAVVTCVDSHFLDNVFVGRVFDERFLSELPDGVDHCGENGEFHSFVYDGPIFTESIPYVKDQVVLRENRFYYCDLMPVSVPV